MILHNHTLGIVVVQCAESHVEIHLATTGISYRAPGLDKEIAWFTTSQLTLNPKL